MSSKGTPTRYPETDKVLLILAAIWRWWDRLPLGRR